MVVLGKDNACAEVAGDTGSFSLRIGGLFAIMFGSAILTFLPVVARNRCQLLLQLGSCFATGVVLATAFVHMIPDASAYPVHFDSIRKPDHLCSCSPLCCACSRQNLVALMDLSRQVPCPAYLLQSCLGEQT